MAATVRTQCAGCAGRLQTILDLGSTPLADSFPAAHGGQVETSYPLRLAACEDCKLCQLLDIVENNELFGDKYAFRTSGSPALVAQYRDWAAWALGAFGPQARRLTVDIGSNDGTLLRYFLDAGCNVCGVEPSAAAAQGSDRGVPAWCGVFTRATAAQIVSKHGQAGLITGINVVAHVVDPVDFLQGVAHLLADDGVAVFEFGDLAHLLASCSYDNVYHEHRFVYSLESFAQLARYAGLGVRHYMPTPGQGGSLRVVLDKESRTNITSPFISWAMLDTLQDRVNWSRARLVGAAEVAAETGVLAGYGATAKSCTMLNFCHLGGDLISYIEDLTPGKTGRVSPGMHIPIVAPGQRPRPDTFLLLAWNYLGAVLRRETNYLSKGGKFLVPYTVPVTI